MSLVIRLQRVGKKKYPIYRIVVIQAKAGRNAAPLDKIGLYNPFKRYMIHPKHMLKPKAADNLPFKILTLDHDKLVFWMGRGASIRTSVLRLIFSIPLKG